MGRGYKSLKAHARKCQRYQEKTFKEILLRDPKERRTAPKGAMIFIDSNSSVTKIIENTKIKTVKGMLLSWKQATYNWTMEGRKLYYTKVSKWLNYAPIVF